MKWTFGRVVAAVVVVAVLGIVLVQQVQAPSTSAPAQNNTHTAAPAQAGQQQGTAQPGPTINQQAKDADLAQAANKLILGVVCVLLLVIVFLGRRGRVKHRRRLKNLQNAKS